MTIKTPNNRAHIQYKDKNGRLLPGSTTIINLLNKPFLVNWAYNLGRQGLDMNKIRNTAMSVGSLTHDIILCSFTGKTPDTTDYTQNQIDEAQNSLRSFYAWHKLNPIELILIEKPLISDTFGFGGTLDIYGKMADGNVLLDFKTSKMISFEYYVQVASYGQLIFENFGTPPDKGKILRINKQANDDFEIRTVNRMDKYFEVFRHLLMVYNLQKELT